MNARQSTRHARESSIAYALTLPTVTAQELKRLRNHIVRAAHQRLIIVFGSRAYGTPRPTSDLDVLVVTDETNLQFARAQEIRKLVPGFPVPLHVHTRTPEMLTQRLEMGEDFAQEIVSRGQQLYPTQHKNGFAKQVRHALEQGRTAPMDNGEIVQEWVEKAEGDFHGAQMWARQRKNFRSEKLCWDCEQCSEKYLKAFLTRHRIKFKRDHKLDELLAACQEIDSDFRLIQNFLDAVSPCTPIIRYPGAGVTEEQARAAFAATRAVRKFIRPKLGLH